MLEIIGSGGIVFLSWSVRRGSIAPRERLGRQGETMRIEREDEDGAIGSV
jgi:hypothetical protein